MSHDSKAVFRAAVFNEGLGVHYDKFVALKWTTFAQLCFTTSVKPGQDEEVFCRDVLDKALGSRDHEDQGLLRRLFCEAYLRTSTGMKQDFEPGAADLPQKIPIEEIDERRKELAFRLEALTVDGKFKGEMDCSDSLIERCIHMRRRNCLALIGFEWSTKREFDILGGSRDPVLTPTADSKGFIQMRLQQAEERPCFISSDMHFQNAYIRRGLALDMADVLAWELHEKLRLKLQAQLALSPPTGYRRVTLEQVLSADRSFWVQLAQETDGKVKRDNSGERPCDAHFSTVFKSFDFYMTYAPRQGFDASSSSDRQSVPKTAAAAAPAAAEPPRLSKKEKQAIKNKLKDEEISALKQKSLSGPQGGGGKGAKSAGKGGKPVRMPAELVGMCPKTSAATGLSRLCYGFNLGTCTAVGPGKTCTKGLHGCMKPDPATGEACGGPHPCTGCKK